MRLRVKLALALVMAVALMLADQGLSDLADGAAASAELLASAPAVRSATGPGGDTSAAVRLFDRYRTTYPDYLSIRLLDGAGGVLAQAAAIGFHGDSPLADPYAAEVAARAGPAPRFDMDANADLLRVYRAVQDPDAAATGAASNGHVVALSVALTPLYARLVTEHLGWSGALLLVQADGEVLYDSGRAPLAPPPSVLRETLGHLGTTLTPRRLDWGGEPSLVMARALREGLTAVAVQPLRGLSHPLDTLAVQTVAISFFSALLLVAVLFIWLRRLVLRPLKSLRSAARAIGTGRRVPPVTVRGDDELGLLGAELREMAERLGQYNEQIEQLAFYDQLTGLPNRNLIRDLLTQRMGAPRRADEVLALLFVDLDNFKCRRCSTTRAWSRAPFSPASAATSCSRPWTGCRMPTPRPISPPGCWPPPRSRWSCRRAATSSPRAPASRSTRRTRRTPTGSCAARTSPCTGPNPRAATSTGSSRRS